MGRVWVGNTVYVPELEVTKARQQGRREAMRGLRYAFAATWLLMFGVLLLLATASRAYAAGPCGTG